MSPSIEFKTVTFTYPHFHQKALMDFTVSCAGSSIYAVLGPNGGGKSTFLQLCAGLLKPDSGCIKVSEHPAYLPQQERVAFAFSVLEYVLFGRAPHLPFLHVPSSRDEAKAMECLRSLGVEHIAQKRITEISGGELQLARFARVLVQESNILLLDEPTDMLDPAHIVRIAEMLQREKERKKLIIFSTHDLMLVQSCADNAILIKNSSLMNCSRMEACLTEAQMSLLFGIPMQRRMTYVPILPS